MKARSTATIILGAFLVLAALATFSESFLVALLLLGIGVSLLFAQAQRSGSRPSAASAKRARIGAKRARVSAKFERASRRRAAAPPPPKAGEWLTYERMRSAYDAAAVAYRMVASAIESANKAVEQSRASSAPVPPPPVYAPTRPAAAVTSPPAPSKADRGTPPVDRTSRLPNGETAYQHAIAAARLAGLDVYASLLPLDLGLMTYAGDQRALYRAGSPGTEAEFVQPFAVLYVSQRASGRVRFEIIDADGQRLFVDEDIQELKPGANLISPASRLRILDAHNFAGNWQLVISADGVPLAIHNWTWQETRETVLRRHLSEDGELHQDVRSRLTDEDPFNRVSLDDLLSDQPPAEPKRARSG